MRAYILALILGIATLGWVGFTPSQAEAREWHGHDTDAARWGGWRGGWHGGYRGWGGWHGYRGWGSHYYYPSYGYGYYGWPAYGYSSYGSYYYPGYSSYYYSPYYSPGVTFYWGW